MLASHAVSGCRRILDVFQGAGGGSTWTFHDVEVVHGGKVVGTDDW
jgi:hypothetical protein